MKRTSRHFVLGLAVLLGSVVAAPLSQAADHDQGFFLRLGVGISAAGSSLEDSFGDELTLSGPGVDFDVAVGYTIVENLALHASIFGWTVADPDAEFNGESLGSLDTTFTLSAFGVGMTYYIMPANIYVSGSVGGGTLSLDVSGDFFESTIESKTGFAGQLSVGKEWFVGERWGLGAALSSTFHSIPDDSGLDSDFSGASFGVRFSATMN